MRVKSPQTLAISATVHTTRAQNFVGYVAKMGGTFGLYRVFWVSGLQAFTYIVMRGSLTCFRTPEGMCAWRRGYGSFPGFICSCFKRARSEVLHSAWCTLQEGKHIHMSGRVSDKWLYARFTLSHCAYIHTRYGFSADFQESGPMIVGVAARC